MMLSNPILILVASLLTAGACTAPQPQQPDPEKEQEVTPVTPTPGSSRYIQDLTLTSSTLREHIKYSVFLPADYDKDTQTRYSVVYMLHGLGDNNNSWNGDYLHANEVIRSLETKGLTKMIYVFPQGFASYYCNFYDGSYNYMDMFINELIPLIDKNYRTLANKEHRAITGYSMGGFGACALAEKHPETFAACAPLSMSVRTDWQYMEESQSGWENQWGIIFGGLGQSGEGRITEYYKQHCPIHYFNAENKEALSTVQWYFICGDDEKNLLYSNDQLHCVLRDNGYAHEYRVVNGGHSSSVWNPALEEVLPLFDYYMNGGTLWSPERQQDATPAMAERAQDGSWASPKYKENNTGTILYVAYSDLSATVLDCLFYQFQMDPLFDNGYVMVPCDVTQKTLTEWMTDWDARYPNTKKLVMGINQGAQEALALPANTFKRYYFLNPACPDNVPITQDQEVYFAGTDTGSNYQGMNHLYNACKKNGAKFEYRIVKGYGDPVWDMLSSFAEIKSQLFY